VLGISSLLSVGVLVIVSIALVLMAISSLVHVLVLVALVVSLTLITSVVGVLVPSLLVVSAVHATVALVA